MTLDTGYFVYEDSELGDRLVRVAGTEITYDSLGNPSFTYNDEGIRTSKAVNGITTTYHLDGSQIIAEETETYIIVYLYDAAGSPIGMQYREFTFV